MNGEMDSSAVGGATPRIGESALVVGGGTISIHAEQLRKVPEILAVAGGLAKADAIGIALRAGMATTLITNSSVARHLLDKSRDTGGPGERPTAE